MARPSASPIMKRPIDCCTTNIARLINLAEKRGQKMKRRDFVTGGAALPLAAAATAPSSRPTLCFFSKHLQDLNYDRLGKALHDIGFAGVDLTVRPQGHVLPERAAEDLPRAYEIIRSHGIEVPMISTGLLSASDP